MSVVSPEAAVGGTIALIQNGDETGTDAKKESFSLMLKDILENRKENQNKECEFGSGALWKFSQNVGLQDMELSPPRSIQRKKIIQIFVLIDR